MEIPQPTVLDVALKHGVKEEDILHAFRNPVHLQDADDEGFSVWIGPSYSGELLEVGMIDSDEGPVIIHAMKARPKYLRFLHGR